MSVTINGTTGVSLVQDGAITSANLPAGSVLQVVSTTKTDTTSTSSSTLSDIPGMSVSITPSSSSSKIFVLASIVVGTGNAHASVALNRDGTDIGIGDASGSRAQLTTSTTSAVSPNNQPSFMGLTYLDSPATTSSTTYKLRWRSNDNNVVVAINRTTGDENSASYGRFISTITVMEIAA